MRFQRIGIAITRYPPVIGGAELHTHELAKRLSAHGDVRVATLVDHRTTDWLGETLTSSVRTGKHCWLEGVEVIIPCLDRAELAIVQNLLHTYKARPEIRHVLSRALVSIYRTKLEEIFSGCDVVHCVHVGSPIFDLAAYEAARRCAIPFVFTPLVHIRAGNCDSEELLFLYEHSDALVAMTEFEKGWLVEHGAEPSKVFVQGVGPLLSGAVYTVKRGERRETRPRVTFIGQKLPSKGLDTLLKSRDLVWEDLPDVEFLFVGPRTPYSEDLFRNVNDRRIVEVDEVDAETKTRVLRDSSLLCSTSLEESFGGTLIEAWTMGKPVVAVETEVSRELVEASQGGVCVPNRSDAVAEAIVYMLSDPALAEAMGARGKKFVESRYTWEKLVTGYVDIYRELMGERALSRKVSNVA